MAVIFIDLKSAYNTVNREVLFEIIRTKNILTESEASFLEKLYNSLYIVSGSTREKRYFKNGVQQGSILSPLLFNIYFNEVLQRITSLFGSEFFRKVYADDLVVVIKAEELDLFLDIAKAEFLRADLIFNAKKSKIFFIRK